MRELPIMTRASYLLYIAVAIVALAVYIKSKPTQTSLIKTEQPQLGIALLGDQTRLELIHNLASVSNAVSDEQENRVDFSAVVAGKSLNVSTIRSDLLVSHVANCAVADIAVITVDARSGAMPIHREHILFARQMEVPTVLVMFTHSDAIEDAELLELQELEMRELFGLYDYNRDEVIVEFDSSVERGENITSGEKALLQTLARQARRLPHTGATLTDSCTLYLYALTEESAYPLVFEGIESGEYTFVIGSLITPVMIHASPGVAPGYSDYVKATFSSPISVHLAQRCVLVTKNHLAAAAVITSLGSEPQTE